MERYAKVGHDKLLNVLGCDDARKVIVDPHRPVVSLHVTWPGDYHYLANSVIESAKTGIPLLNDLPNHLPIPGLDPNMPHNDAKILSSILAIECRLSPVQQLPQLNRLQDGPFPRSAHR